MYAYFKFFAHSSERKQILLLLLFDLLTGDQCVPHARKQETKYLLFIYSSSSSSSSSCFPRSSKNSFLLAFHFWLQRNTSIIIRFLIHLFPTLFGANVFRHCYYCYVVSNSNNILMVVHRSWWLKIK